MSTAAQEKRTPSKLPRLDFHVAENAEKPACLLIEEESGLMVAEFPNSPQGIEDCMGVIKAVNGHDALVAALRGSDEFIARFFASLPTGDPKGDYWRENCAALRARNTAALALVEGRQ